MTRRAPAFVLVLLIAGCTSSSSPGERQEPASPAPAESALIDELVLANRILASPELGVFDSAGHVSARSQAAPGRYYISRAVAPALVTRGDVIENDLDGEPVAGARMDQYPDRALDGAIYRARSDVMAVVHLHTPQVVAFSITEVPLGDNPPAVFAGSDELNTAGAVEPLVAQLGRRPFILVRGHGAVVVGSSLQAAVSAANALVRSAELVAQTMALGGTVLSNPRGTALQPAMPLPAVGGFAGRQGGNRAWDHWTRVALARMDGRVTAAPPAHQRVPPRSKATLIDDLVTANRILSSRELGILDALGHVSVRHPDNPNRFFISRAISAGSVTAADIIENDLDSRPVTGPRDDQFQEVYLHGEIYKARPDVMAVLHSHTPEFVAFSQSSVPMRIVSRDAAFIGAGLQTWVIGKYDSSVRIVSNPAVGRALATDLGRDRAILLAGHGIAHTGASLYDLVADVHALRVNARIQQQAILLGGRIDYLEVPAAGAAEDAGILVLAPDGSGGGVRDGERAWEYWRQIVERN